MAGLAVPLWDVSNGQGLRQLAELGLALLLSTLIGWERAAQQKSAGLRTHTLVGIAVHVLVVRGYPLLFAHLMPGVDPATFEVRLTYRTGTALLPQLMETCTRRGFRIQEVKVDRLPERADPAARVLLQLEGAADAGQLTSELFQNDGVSEVELTAAEDEE